MFTSRTEAAPGCWAQVLDSDRVFVEVLDRVLVGDSLMLLVQYPNGREYVMKPSWLQLATPLETLAFASRKRGSDG